jgi:folate/biopterin transporter
MCELAVQIHSTLLLSMLNPSSGSGFPGGLQLFAWASIAMFSGVSSTANILTAFLTITNFGGAISEVVQDAMLAEAGKNKVGAQQGMRSSSVNKPVYIYIFFVNFFEEFCHGTKVNTNQYTSSFSSLFSYLSGWCVVVSHSGELQSFAWLAMAGGGVVGNLTAGYAMKLLSPKAMVLVFVSLLSLQLLLAFFVNEHALGLGPVKKSDSPDSQGRKLGVVAAMWDQIARVRDSLRQPALWRPLLWFLSSYLVIPGIGGAIFFFQTEHLGLHVSVLGLARLVGQVGLLLGSMLFNKALKGLPLRRMFASVQILLSLCMLTDIIIVKRINVEWGIPDKWFVLGASAFVEAIGQFKILPFTVLLAQLCPPGSEASVFAFFASAQTIAGLTNGYLGVALANYLQITAKDFSGLPLGILIQSFCAMLPVLWIGLIPAEPKRHKEIQMNAVEEDTKKEL